MKKRELLKQQAPNQNYMCKMHTLLNKSKSRNDAIRGAYPSKSSQPLFFFRCLGVDLLSLFRFQEGPSHAQGDTGLEVSSSSSNINFGFFLTVRNGEGQKGEKKVVQILSSVDIFRRWGKELGNRLREIPRWVHSEVSEHHLEE